MYGLLVAQEENAYFIQTQKLEPVYPIVRSVCLAPILEIKCVFSLKFKRSP